MDVDWVGVFPALMTGFKQDGVLDLEATARHMESCLDAGVTGIVMLGTLGENPSLYPDEKEQVLNMAVETAAGRVPVLSGVAEYTTDMAIDHVRRAEKAGCEGLMVPAARHLMHCCRARTSDVQEGLPAHGTCESTGDLHILIDLGLRFRPPHVGGAIQDTPVGRRAPDVGDGICTAGRPLNKVKDQLPVQRPRRVVERRHP